MRVATNLAIDHVRSQSRLVRGPPAFTHDADLLRIAEGVVVDG